MNELVTYIASQLVDNPDDVSVNKVEDGETDVYELSVHNDDLGRVIGRAGSTARAIRAILRSGAAKAGRFAYLEILE